MCGIVFTYSPQLELSERTKRVHRGLTRIAHRGPDDQGIIADKQWAMGHRRLSIIGPTSGHQPINDPSGRYFLTYNGEVYNYQELRTGPLKHWPFRTQSDTEVVLAGLITYGPNFFHQMEGMWAVAFWDQQERELVLARDRMGKKPLYYQLYEEAICCASELPALFSLSAQPLTEDLNSTADYFRYGYYLPGTTAYKGICEVLPGHLLTWSPESKPHSRPYWSLSTTPFTGTHQQAQALLQDKFIQAIQRRLVADVEIGAFLSGGIDSSLIVSLLSKKLDFTPKTFTLGFSETAYDERSYARLIAKKHQTQHYERCLEQWDVTQLQQLIQDHIGQPFADSSLLPTALVSELASQHVKVVLSGDGGDELFSGYQRYQARAILRWYTRLPKGLRKGLGRMIRALPEPMAHHSRSLLKKAHLFEDIVQRMGTETPYLAPLFYSQADFQRLAPELAGYGHTPPHLPEESRLDDIQAMMAADALIYLPQDILTKVDRASMAYGLECRAPFLDKEIVELAFSLPRRWHRQGLKGKCFLRETFGEYFSAEIWHRRKQGFAAPIHNWFRGTMGTELEILLQEGDSPLHPSPFLALLTAHRKKQRDHGYRLWQIYVYLLWRSRHTQQLNSKPYTPNDLSCSNGHLGKVSVGA
ncbi:asparagine synthase (glutamine-hydrolyzing) [Nitrosococcus watsonii]|uniref:asparagine synthase (glutamine-hydrolyzing) n=1 Tax=Nitrosococcus watsoni (strain C-113) TaxID=105559 RepID=D8K9W3_NITWC|nr:asparagine synthase (glutamine-hydrolyzing) [Nitrosococcus watsonii]ADJ29321.1 asparagine synthase (glutamine-hydrolyzing) [Nitrosococcus watsonii C-113]